MAGQYKVFNCYTLLMARSVFDENLSSNEKTKILNEYLYNYYGTAQFNATDQEQQPPKK